MANTKYPLNGRPATLGDLVHEFALASSWPSKIAEQNEYDGWSTNLDSMQPFQSLIFQNLGDYEYEAISPYELVWFGDIYDQDTYDPITKMRKLIQMGDTSVYGFDRYIIASKISDESEIFNNGIPFRFIIPDKVTHPAMGDYGDDQEHYVYNYKLDNGQATVMYTLQCIIDTLQEIDDSGVLGNLRNPEHHDSIYLYLFGNDENDNTRIIRCDSNNFLYPLFYSIDLSTNLDTGILEIDATNKVYVKPTAYKDLGSFYWTNKNVQYSNYTTETNFNAPRVNNTGKSLDYLKRLIYYIALGTYKSFSDSDTIDVDKEFDDTVMKSLLLGSVQVQLLFYTYWFLNTQRYHTSFITACQFIKISDVTYLPKQPVLKCDLSLQRFIEDFTILNAVHEVNSMLPPGPLSPNTTIVINISYSAKYKNVGKRTESSFELPLTFLELKQISGNQESDLMWLCWQLPGGDPPELNNSNMIGYQYGNPDYFPFIENNDDYWSLKNIKWPAGNSYNLLISKKYFEQAKTDINFENGNCYADTYSLASYNNIMAEEVATKIKNYNRKLDDTPNTFAPGGLIRLHKRYQPKVAESSYYLDVALLRRKNYYYQETYASIEEDAEAEGNVEVHLYFEPVYHTGETVISANSTTEICSYRIGYSQPNPTTKEELDMLFSSRPNRHITIPYINSNDFRIYVSVKSLSGTMEYYISGDSLFKQTSSSSIEYVTFDNILIDKFAPHGIWYPYDQGPNIVTSQINNEYDSGSDSQVETQTELKVDSRNANSYTYYRMHFANGVGAEQVFYKNYIYFRMSPYTNTSSFKLRYLLPNNCKNSDLIPGIKSLGPGSAEDVYINKSDICFITYHPNDDINKTNMKYTVLTTREDDLAEATIGYISSGANTSENLILRLTAIQNKDVTGKDRYVYKQIRQAYDNESLIYITYMLYSSYDLDHIYYILKFQFIESTQIFNNITLNAAEFYPANVCKVYISFMPIYIFLVIIDTLPSGLSDAKVNKLSYKRIDSRNNNVIEEDDVNYVTNIENNGLKYMAASFINAHKKTGATVYTEKTIVYLKPENMSVKVNNQETDLSDPGNIFFNQYNVNIAYLRDENMEIGGQMNYMFKNNYEVDDQGKATINNINFITRINDQQKVIFKEQTLSAIRLTFREKT